MLPTEWGVVVKRIVLVEFPPSGGLFQFALQLGEALAKDGDRVDVVTGPSPELDSRVSGCRVRSILPTWHPTAGAGAPEWWRKARRAVRGVQHALAWLILIGYLAATRPDIVAWSSWRFPVDGWGVRVVRRLLPRATLVLVAHEPRPLVEQPGHDGMYKTSAATRGALAGAYAVLDVVYVLGDSAKQVVTEVWPTTATVRVMPHGDEGIFAGAELPEVSSTQPVALVFGTITNYKGIDTLCAAWPAVRARVPTAQLVIAGALSADVDENGLRNEVAGLDGAELHAGYIPVAEVSSLFARARCVVLPYKRSSQSGVAHLAHTLGRPVVASRVGDIPSVVIDGVSGLLVEPEDPVSLAAAVVRLLTDQDYAHGLGREGCRALADRASWDQVAAAFRAGLPERTPPD
ncbi:glycosyltransferase involved in cell wall biosynthesis [Mycolicibacterium sp. 624]